MLSALWPQPGHSAREQARHLPGIYTEAYRQAPKVRYADGSTGMSPEVARDLLYQDCDTGGGRGRRGAAAAAALGDLERSRARWSTGRPFRPSATRVSTITCSEARG